MSRRPVPPAGESYHTQHAPFGAFASFTVGLVDAPGGFGQSLGGPAKQNVYVGFRGASHAQWQFLPFLTPPRSKAADYTGEVVAHTPTDYHALRPADYERTLGWASDTWRADNARFGFSLLSPFDTVPDPVKLRPAAARFHLAPLVCGWIEYDNRAGTAPVELMFGIGDSTRPLRPLSDTTAALEALGKAARARSQARIVGVTGSVGKTGVKEAIFAALDRASRGEAHRSVKSYNNHVGVPLSLARMPSRTRFGVFEMGMNHAGEIAALTRQVRPHVPAAALADLQRGERGDRVAQCGRVELRAEAAHHPVRLQPVQPGLHGAAGHAEPARGLHHPDPRLVGEQPDQPGVQGVHGHTGDLLGDLRHSVRLVSRMPQMAERYV